MTRPDRDHDEESAHGLRAAVRRLGYDVGYFIVKVSDVGAERYDLLLACDPRWGLAYERRQCFLHDPWLRYASISTAPIVATAVDSLSALERQTVTLAHDYGLRNVVLYPAPSANGASQFALLVLGSPGAATMDGVVDARLRAACRDLAMALHERWAARLREDFLYGSGLTQSDLKFLELEARGLGSKQIARTLDVTCAAVDSRFQRVNRKLNVTSRAEAAIRARRHGLLSPDIHDGAPDSRTGTC